MKFIFDQLVVAYSGYMKWLGLFLGAVAILNWVVVGLDMDLFGALAVLIGLYQSTFYAVFAIPEKILGISIPNGLKDLILFYLVLGGVTMRTWVSFFQKFDEADDATIGDYAEPLSIQVLKKANSGFVNSVLNVLSFILWPLALRPFWRRPIVVLKEEKMQLWVPAREYREVREANKDDDEFEHWSVVDMRVVWTLQLLAMLLTVISLIGLHEFLASS